MKIAVYDHGLNTEAAIKLAYGGHSVAYFSEWREAFPRCVNESVGLGLEGLVRVNDFHKAADKADMVVCFDTHSKDIVNHYNQHKPTFGAGDAEQLEQDRFFCKDVLKKAKLPVAPFVKITGIDNLIDHLRKVKDKWVKFSGEYRGDTETFHHEDWPTTMRGELGVLLMGFGPFADRIEVMVEDSIKSECEVGYDGFFNYGSFTDGMVGYEAKDKAYVGRFRTYDQMPPVIRQTNAAVVPCFIRTSATIFSTELRLPGPYLIDPCVRAPHPPLAAELEMFDNFADIVTKYEDKFMAREVSNAADYAVVIEVKSDQIKEHCVPIFFDQKYRHLIKLQRATRIDKTYWVLPGSFVACNVVGLGETIEAARKECLKALETVKIAGMSYDLDALDKLIEETIPNGEKLGIKF